ncbi:MAG: uncharacterized protein KVP18_002569, partial [Porospora cf. gigantea A]|uniref:uncharacterized protein n=2 Tax=Porospora cf. gigantea A TaxID=2853593 RepID=UPI003559A900
DPRDHYREHEKDYARESLYYGREDTMHKYYGREPGREVQYREPEPDYGRIAYPPREYREEYPARDYYDERPASEDVFSRKIYVGNLRHQIDVGMLKAHFGNFGEIENAEVMSSKFTGVSRGFGFVVFRGTAAMERVLAREHIVDGLRLEVKRAFPKGDRPPSPARSAPVKVVEPPRYYPRNDQHSFYYSPAREPARDIPRDLPRDLPVPDRPRESRESRDERHYSGQSRAYPSKERARSSIWAECEEPGKLWVGTFQEKPDEDQVRAYFSKYGEVADMVILESRNFGFVVFRRPRDAEDAIGKHPEFGRKFEAKVALARGLPKETEAYMRSGRAKPYDY